MITAAVEIAGDRFEAEVVGWGRSDVWRCFHCAELFVDESSAAEHFGTSERQNPACQIDIAEYREMESRMVRYNEEDADIHREMRRMDGEHRQALRREEEIGYARGLAAQHHELAGWDSERYGYTTLFNAIEAAIEWHPHKTFGISVKAFNNAMVAEVSRANEVPR